MIHFSTGFTLFFSAFMFNWIIGCTLDHRDYHRIISTPWPPSVFVKFGLGFYCDLTPQQQPGSFRGGDDDDEMSVSLVEETGVPAFVKHLSCLICSH